MLKKIAFKAAVDQELSGECYLIHLKWMPELAEKHPDCTHALIRYQRKWYRREHRMAVVLRDDESEANYEHKKAQEALKRESLSSKDRTGS